MSEGTSESGPMEIRVKGKAARIRGATWTNDQVKKLFQVWTQPDIYDGLQNEKKKLDIFKNMATMLSDMGVTRTWRECRAKMKNLKADFRKALEKKTQFKYYDDMKHIMNLDTPSTELKRSSSTITLDRFFTSTRSSSASGQSFGYTPGDDEYRSSQETGESMPSTSRSLQMESFERSRSADESEGSRYTRDDSGAFHRRSTEHDSSSRSSMVISHVVSNVIEPVTQVVLPSTSGFRIERESPPPPPPHVEILHVSPGIMPAINEEETTAPPIRLEFLLQDENVILQPPRTSPSPIPDEIDINDEPVDLVTTRTSPIPMSSQETTPERPSVTPEKSPRKRTLTPTRPIYPPKKSPAFRPQQPSTPSKPKKIDRKKQQKLLETLNKTTAETISNLLTETSQNLIKELQDAEQRFIMWEEEKRSEERKREEFMFSKLVNAMQSPTVVSPSSISPEDQPSTNVVQTFSTMSRRINDLVCEEVKGTEESMRQWEMKMQRQESRHTEKLFAMIINAIKTSSTNTE